MYGDEVDYLMLHICSLIYIVFSAKGQSGVTYCKTIFPYDIVPTPSITEEPEGPTQVKGL